MNNTAPHFEQTGYGKDFEAIVPAPARFAISGQGEPALWLKAYDTAYEENPDDSVARELGFGFCCEVAVKDDDPRRHQVIARFAAQDRTAAERMLASFAAAVMRWRA